MDLLDSGFWLGLAFAIPGSVAANLVTPHVRAALAKRSRKKSDRLADELQKELDDVRKLATDASKHQIFLLESVLLITLLTTAIGALVAFFYLLSMFFGGSVSLITLSRMLGVAGGVMVAMECVTTLRKSNRIKRFDEYQAKVEAQLSKLREPMAKQCN